MMKIPRASERPVFQKQWSKVWLTIKCMDSAWEITLAGNSSGSAELVYHNDYRDREYLTYR